MLIATVATLAVLAPLAAALLLVCWPSLRRTGRGAAAVSIAATAGSLAGGLWVAAAVAGLSEALVVRQAWLPGGDGAPIATLGLLLDPIAGVMLVVVAVVSLAVQLYSLGYMHDEPPASLGRYYTYLALFTFSMLGLVVAESLLQLFLCWELVGLSSYLLIGFWYRKPAAARAAQKAFWTTKLGDLGMLAGLVVLWAATGTFSIPALSDMARSGAIAATTLAWGAFLLYSGAVGKSAQVPLHVWLPDAMEGPTPVSALIHAATMVAAGVYLVIRAFPIFAAVPAAMGTIAWIGAATALLAALLATVQTDIKRVLAFSTVSQLGFMMAALGAGGVVAGYFHLFTHAGFKALLFLAAGSVIHAVGTNDLRAMAGARLARAMPQTACLFTVGALALAGIWPFAGFFSKDEVLVTVGGAGLWGPLFMLLAAATLTAFYISRAGMLAFFATPPSALPLPESDGRMATHALTLHGEETGLPTHPAELSFGGPRGASMGLTTEAPVAPVVVPGPNHAQTHLAAVAHESPAIMTLPMWVLAIAAAFAGWLAHPFAAYLEPAVGAPHEVGAAGAWPPAAAIPLVALSLAVMGLAAGVWRYRAGAPAGAPAALAPFARLLERGLYVDAAYEALFRRGLLGAAGAIAWVDRHVVDGAVNLTADLTRAAGEGLRQIQTGRAQDYVYGFLAGILALAAWTYFLTP